MGTHLRKLDTDWITGRIIGGAIDVHRYLGPGMLEHTYEVCLERRSGSVDSDGSVSSC